MALTREETVAKKLAELVSDLRVDLVTVAEYVYDLSPNVTINRIILVGEMLQSVKEETHNDYI